FLSEETHELQRADVRLRAAIEDVDHAIDQMEKQALELAEEGYEAVEDPNSPSYGVARLNRGIDPVSQRQLLENLMIRRDALMKQKRELQEERVNIRSLIAHDFEVLSGAMQAAKKASHAPGDHSFHMQGSNESAFLSTSVNRAGGLSPLEAQLARMIPDAQGLHGQARTVQEKHAFNRAKIDYYKGQLRGDDLLHQQLSSGINLVDFLEQPDPVEIEEAEALEKEAELKKRAESLQAVVKEKNELIKRMMERTEEAGLGGQEKGPDGKAVSGSISRRGGLVSQKTLHDIADHSVERMIQESWKHRVDQDTDREFKDLKEQLNQVKEQHKEERFRTMLQDLQDLRSDPSLQVYYDAPTVSLDTAMERSGLAGSSTLLENVGTEVLRKGYLQADYLNEDTIKGNIRTILSEGVYSALGVHREPDGEMVADAVTRAKTHSPLMSPQGTVIRDRIIYVPVDAQGRAVGDGSLDPKKFGVRNFGAGNIATTEGMTPLLDNDGRPLHDTNLPDGYQTLVQQEAGDFNALDPNLDMTQPASIQSTQRPSQGFQNQLANIKSNAPASQTMMSHEVPHNPGSHGSIGNSVAEQAPAAPGFGSGGGGGAPGFGSGGGGGGAPANNKPVGPPAGSGLNRAGSGGFADVVRQSQQRQSSINQPSSFGSALGSNIRPASGSKAGGGGGKKANNSSSSS
ncbi:unnamed protein product, partial [Amoebophrya sp. A120]